MNGVEYIGRRRPIPAAGRGRKCGIVYGRALAALIGKAGEFFHIGQAPAGGALAAVGGFGQRQSSLVRVSSGGTGAGAAAPGLALAAALPGQSSAMIRDFCTIQVEALCCGPTGTDLRPSCGGQKGCGHQSDEECLVHGVFSVEI